MTGRQILLVDDEEGILEFVGHIVSDVFPNCVVQTAPNGVEAFKICKARRFDLIVTDHKMPLMTGTDLIVNLRTKPSLNSKTPVIMLSGFIDTHFKTILNSRGIAFVDKPIDMQKFKLELEKQGLMTK
ncbi:MAG: response regulator [Bdellovibrionota bacterium]